MTKPRAFLFLTFLGASLFASHSPIRATSLRDDPKLLKVPPFDPFESYARVNFDYSGSEIEDSRFVLPRKRGVVTVPLLHQARMGEKFGHKKTYNLFINFYPAGSYLPWGGQPRPEILPDPVAWLAEEPFEVNPGEFYNMSTSRRFQDLPAGDYDMIVELLSPGRTHEGEPMWAPNSMFSLRVRVK
jgi:hypothetical protein